MFSSRGSLRSVVTAYYIILRYLTFFLFFLDRNFSAIRNYRGTTTTTRVVENDDGGEPDRRAFVEYRWPPRRRSATEYKSNIVGTENVCAVLLPRFALTRRVVLTHDSRRLTVTRNRREKKNRALTIKRLPANVWRNATVNEERRKKYKSVFSPTWRLLGNA